MAREFFREFHSVDVAVRANQVDSAMGVIRGVKILGLQSRNNRTYLPEALARGAALYEGAKVNVNHPKGAASGPRDYQDRMGVIRNVQQREGAGLFADFHFNPRHALAEQLLWDAEHAPENVGFSHNVEAKTSRSKDGRTIVEEILRVESVDLVADPATTRGLFEGVVGDALDASARMTAIANVNQIAQKLLCDVMTDEAEDDPAVKLTRVLGILADWQLELRLLLKSTAAALPAVAGPGGANQQPADEIEHWRRPAVCNGATFAEAITGDVAHASDGAMNTAKFVNRISDRNGGFAARQSAPLVESGNNRPLSDGERFARAITQD